MGAVFSKDDGRILTWSNDGTARLWDTASGAQIGPALKHDNPVLGAVFSTDDGRILSWSEDRTARLWEAASGEQIGPALKHGRWVRGAVFSKDEGRILTWSEDGTVRLWEAASGVQIGPAIKHKVVRTGERTDAIFSKDRDRILTWGADGTARLWDVKWATRNDAKVDFIRDLCREKLAGASIPARPQPPAPEVRTGLRYIDAGDTEAAPILRGREGEDVCAPPPTIWETLMSLLR